jgi:WD40 repeat protein
MLKTSRTLLSAAVVLAICQAVVLHKNRANWPLRGDGQKGSQDLILAEHRYPVHCVVFAPDGLTVAAGGGFNERAGEVRLWDLATGVERVCLGRLKEAVSSMAFAAEGQTLATVSLGRIVRVWDVPSGCKRQNMKLPIALAPSLAVSPDGGTFALGGWEREARVKLWYRSTGVERTLDAGSGPVAFSPDGQRLASAGRFPEWATVKIWDPATGQELWALRGHQDPVWSVAFSPDGRIVASASGDKTVRLWEAVSGRERAILRGHTGQVYTVAFAPDGKRLASGSADQTVKIWNLASHSDGTTLRGHRGGVTSVAFAPDGQRLASGSYDKTVRLWSSAKKP